MAYTAYPKSGSAAEVAAYTKVRKELEELKKKKGDKNKIKELEKEVASKGKLLSDKLLADIKGVSVNFSQHATKIDAALGAIMKEYKAGEVGLESFKKNPDMRQNMANYDLAAKTGERLKAILEGIKQDADEFGKCWFEYRGYNPMKHDNIEKAYADGFSGQVGKLMSAQKTVTSKISKMELFVKQGETLANTAKTFNQKALGQANAGKTESDKLAKETAGILYQMNNKRGANFNGIVQNETTAKGVIEHNAKPTPDIVKNLEGILQNSIACHKLLTNSWRTIEKLVKNANANLGKSTDQEIQANLKKAITDEAAAKKLVDDATVLMKRIVPLISNYNKKLKK
ncbi:MAG: hypothetical protein WCL32_13460 [Planctomycetota bacterium]